MSIFDEPCGFPLKLASQYTNSKIETLFRRRISPYLPQRPTKGNQTKLWSPAYQFSRRLIAAAAWIPHLSDTPRWPFSQRDEACSRQEPWPGCLSPGPRRKQQGRVCWDYIPCKLISEHSVRTTMGNHSLGVAPEFFMLFQRLVWWCGV